MSSGQTPDSRPIGVKGIGVVAIGRNEGDRLKACLRSLPAGSPKVYVDSGSSDGSVAFAEECGVTVVRLDTNKGFTAARGRNAGLRRLVANFPEIEFVQMIDGDCSLDKDWLQCASAVLADNDKLAAVFGRRRERFPRRSAYNRMCDDEWNVPVGIVDSCGGDALFRVQPLLLVGGYRENLIAGEEPDLCLRLRNLGYFVERIDAEMTLHDAAILTFNQWWRRVKRGGYAYAEHCRLHGSDAFPVWRRQLFSIIFWGGLMPGIFVLTLIVVLLGALNSAFLIVVPVIYVLQWSRLTIKKRGSHPEILYKFQYAALIMTGKIAEFAGAVSYWTNKARGKGGSLIEYKKH